MWVGGFPKTCLSPCTSPHAGRAGSGALRSGRLHTRCTHCSASLCQSCFEFHCPTLSCQPCMVSPSLLGLLAFLEGRLPSPTPCPQPSPQPSPPTASSPSPLPLPPSSPSPPSPLSPPISSSHLPSPHSESLDQQVAQLQGFLRPFYLGVQESEALTWEV